MSDQQPSSEEMARRLFGDAEKRTAGAMEQLVHGNAFGELLARTTENAMAVTRIGFDTFDLIVRNLRIAGRQDVARLGRQLARSEDKLERVLQEVEDLRDELERERRARTRSNGAKSSNGRKSTARKSSSARSRSS
jgi:Skp family chaperone for outer membrane proteins